MITFFLIVWLLFIAISALSKMRDDADADKKLRCRFCCQRISQRVRTPGVYWRPLMRRVQALRCPYCTSHLNEPDKAEGVEN